MSGSSEQDSVPSLLPGDSLARLARILHCAQVLGHDAPAGASVMREEASEPPPAAPSASPSVEESVTRLFELLDQRSVDYVLVGGLALLRYVRGRNTEDIDLLLAVRDLAVLPEIMVSERSDWFARAVFSGLRVDLLFTENPLFKLVRERHTGCIPFLERGVPCATPEGLVLLKLYALPSLYRQGQIQRANLYEADIAALVHGPGVDPLPLLQTLEQFMLPTDVRELRRVVEEIRSRRRDFR